MEESLLKRPTFWNRASSYATVIEPPMLPIIDRYILKEISRPMLVVCLVLVAIFASYCATRYLTDASAGLLPAQTVLSLVALKVVIALEVLLPITLYLSIIVGLGRLHADSEMAALAACGIPNRRIAINIFACALFVALFVALLSLKVRPQAYQLSYRLKSLAQATFQVSRMAPNSFFEFDHHRRLIFAEKIDRRRNRITKVFIRQTNNNELQLITARAAFQQRSPERGEILIFNEGRLYNLDRLTEQDTVASFSKYVLVLKPPRIGNSEKIKAVATSELLRERQRPLALAELQWRLSTPLTTLLLALLAIPLSRTTPRRGKYGKTILAIAIYGIFYAFSLALKSWIAEGVLPPWPGLFWIEGGLGMTLAILTRQERHP